MWSEGTTVPISCSGIHRGLMTSFSYGCPAQLFPMPRYLETEVKEVKANNNLCSAV